MKLHETIKTELKKHRRVIHATNKEIDAVIKAFNTNNNNFWQVVFKTNLYVNHGGEYCSLLEVINQLELYENNV